MAWDHACRLRDTAQGRSHARETPSPRSPPHSLSDESRQFRSRDRIACRIRRRIGLVQPIRSIFLAIARLSTRCQSCLSLAGAGPAPCAHRSARCASNTARRILCRCGVATGFSCARPVATILTPWGPEFCSRDTLPCARGSVARASAILAFASRRAAVPEARSARRSNPCALILQP